MTTSISFNGSRVRPSAEVSSSPARTEAQKDETRERFSSPVAFILTCVGFAVGLGNIWRFPAVAYRNGGGAFLIPYICCSVLFGLPMLYLEFSLGQYVQSGTSKLYYKYAPAFQGIGFAMAGLSAQLSIYYYIIVGWVMLYIIDVATGNLDAITSCNSTRFLRDPACVEAAETRTSNSTLRSFVPSERYFDQYIVMRMPTIPEQMFDLGDTNWKLLGVMFVLWLVCAVILWRGIHFMGKVSYVSTIVPYIIIGILFVQGLTLPNSAEGIRVYFQADYSRLAQLDTWKAALTQMCYSLSIGFGGMPSMASFNPRKHNCFRDACIVVVADAFMSIFGGVAVFSILGYLSSITKKPIDHVVKEGFTLAFVAYPQAIAQMSWPGLWMMLFFVMLALLGLSSIVVNVQAVVTCLCDFHPYLQKRRVTVNFGTCFLMFCCGTVMCTEAGIYWFTLFDNCVGGMSLIFVILMEIVLINFVYGIHNLKKDLHAIFGYPKNWFSKIFGPTGYYFFFNWFFISPVLLTIIFIVAVRRGQITYGTDENMLIFPPWSELCGYLLNICVLFFLPFFLSINMMKAKETDGDRWKAFDVHAKHPSFERVSEDSRAERGLCLKEKCRRRFRLMFE